MASIGDTTQVAHPICERFEIRPEGPSEEGMAPMYEVCHICGLWFSSGDWYYYKNFYGTILPNHGTVTRGLHATDSAGNYVHYTCPICALEECPKAPDCPCYGIFYFCEGCQRCKRGLEHDSPRMRPGAMKSKRLCIECYSLLAFAKKISKILVRDRPKDLQELYEIFDAQKSNEVQPT